MRYLIYQASKLGDTYLISHVVAKSGFHNVIRGLQRARDIEIQTWFTLKYRNELTTRNPINRNYSSIYVNEITVIPTSLTHLKVLLSIGYNFSNEDYCYPQWMLRAVTKDPIALRELLRWGITIYDDNMQIELDSDMEFTDECMEVIREERPDAYRKIIKERESIVLSYIID